ncbi:hypothetical protein AB0H82_23590 [Streptomyces sp. NPDC050732]|uniref:hypothetical protein n=1 Tax=Streptomyces sp. NPDC050732 TaxID=3154632 RepID=UPI003449953B
MEHSQHKPGVAWLTEAAKAAEQQGPGNLLRIVLIVMVVGCVLVGWFLLRGYRQGADNGTRTAEQGAERTPPESTEGTTDKGADDRNG